MALGAFPAIVFVVATIPPALPGETPDPRASASLICQAQSSLGPNGGITADLAPVRKALASSDWKRNREALDVLLELSAEVEIPNTDEQDPFDTEPSEPSRWAGRCGVAKVLLAATFPELVRLLRRTKGSRREELLQTISGLEGVGSSPELNAEVARPLFGPFFPRPPPQAAGAPLSKAAVVNGMNFVKAKIAGCYATFQLPGMAMVNVVIAPGGNVSSATVSGKFAGTPTGACVEAAVKTAKFPPSQGLVVPYPFALK